MAGSSEVTHRNGKAKQGRAAEMLSYDQRRNGKAGKGEAGA